MIRQESLLVISAETCVLYKNLKTEIDDRYSLRCGEMFWVFSGKRRQIFVILEKQNEWVGGGGWRAEG